MENSLFPELASLGEPDWTKDARIVRPAQRAHNKLLGKDSSRPFFVRSADLVYEDETLIVWSIQYSLGRAFAIFPRNTPHKQCSLYHKKSKPAVTSHRSAINVGHNLYEKYKMEI